MYLGCRETLTVNTFATRASKRTPIFPCCFSFCLSFLLSSIELLIYKLNKPVIEKEAQQCVTITACVVFLLIFSLYSASLLLSLHVRLWNICAVDFQIDFGVVFSLLPLFVQGLPEVQQIKRQQEPQHTDTQQTDVHLHQRKGEVRTYLTGISSIWYHSRSKVYSVCAITQSGSPFNGPIMAMNKGCCNRANKALTRDCIPVRLPNWDDGYLQTHKDTYTFYKETLWPLSVETHNLVKLTGHSLLKMFAVGKTWFYLFS